MKNALLTSSIILLTATLASAAAPTPEQQAKYGNCISHAYAGGNPASAHIKEVARIAETQGISFMEANEVYKGSELYNKVVNAVGQTAITACEEYALSGKY